MAGRPRNHHLSAVAAPSVATTVPPSAIYRDLRYALDPSALMMDVGLTPDPWQERVLASNADRIILACGRQVGKSTTTAVLVTHQLLFHPGSLSLIIAPSHRQSIERLRLVGDFLQRLGVENIIGEDDIDPTATKITARNGSRAIALPGSGETIRGYSAVDLLLLEEAAMVPSTILAACRPMLAVSKGRSIALSTPAGKGANWFWKAWESNKWEKYHVPSTSCPRIDPKFLEEEHAEMGDMLYRQEYLAEFVDSNEAVFTDQQITEALNTTRKAVSLY